MNYKHASINITAKSPFNFKTTVTSHGWVGLAPNKWIAENEVFERTEQLLNGEVVLLETRELKNAGNTHLVVSVQSKHDLTTEELSEIETKVRHMLRLDEDYSDLYKLAAAKDIFFQKMNSGFGPMLRSPTVFEDIIKTICTTNIQWAGTKRMVNEIVIYFGQNFNRERNQFCFPSPRDIVKIPVDVFRKKTNLGYRTDYIYEFARQVAEGKLDPQHFLSPELKTADLKKMLLSIKGIGPYAAATMLNLLSHYDDLPVDSVFRDFISKKYFKNKKITDKKAMTIYKGWGKWKSLAYWYDLNHDY
jgi:3-methyladenine DNA glycosylase/8-oxoguanine DNA glycosylase